MALFQSKEDKATKQAQKEQELIERYGLEELTDPRDIESAKKIISELAGTNAMQFGSMLAGTEVDFLRNNSYYLRAMIEQNFLIIRLLNRLSK